ncbi:hypothetical protein [Streptomyces sp. CoH17]|uniref:hypothetical protein n=1 Tax=Streptomyces sp. CoH17 TaxID=2992806 RepID=UPI002270310D|nr:hypothetical protein [Streptomyces sp. CoH17]
MTTVVPEQRLENIEYYPGDQNKIRLVWAALQRKYGERPNTAENVRAFQDEAVDRFRKIGFETIIGLGEWDIGADGEPFRPFVVNFICRVVPEKEHDFDRHQFEVQNGHADGVKGRLTNDGRLIEPKKLM